jgi:hypothetical protein
MSLVPQAPARLPDEDTARMQRPLPPHEDDAPADEAIAAEVIDELDAHEVTGAEAIDDLDVHEVTGAEVIAAELTAAEALPVRPPPYAPTIRPSPRRAEPTHVDNAHLATAADTALLSARPDGGYAFEIAFSDELFHDLACEIQVGQDGKVVAVFRVGDNDTRRLLEAEAGRLRAQLEERGLVVAGVRVERV